MMLKTLRDFIGHALIKAGFIQFIIWFTENFYLKKSRKCGYLCVRTRRDRVFQILMYHRVNDQSDGFLPSTSIRTFSMQMQYLAENYSVLSLEDMVACAKVQDVPERAIVVSLDDGYRDNFTQAFPILQQHGLPATVFLATDAIGTGNRLWHDNVCWAISRTTVSVVYGYGKDCGHSLYSPKEKLTAIDNILWYFRSLSKSERDMQLQTLMRELGIQENHSAIPLMLSWDEVRIMRAGGIRFGAHTMSHPILSNLSDEEVRHEVRNSKRVIEENLQESVMSFAYPSGRVCDFNERVRSIVREEGFDCAVTTVSGVNPGDADVFSLKRDGFWDKNPGVFGVRLAYSKVWN